jgi:flagellar protein FliS
MTSVRYLENQVLGADPIGLVLLLNEGAMGAMRQASVLLQEGSIEGRSNAITKSMQIVAELQSTLDLDRGGAIAQNLAQLYAFTQDRLIEANVEQKVAPLEEAYAVISILQQGWKEISHHPPVGTIVEEEDAVAAGSMAWTL